jgi:hypothetical protein
MMLFMSLPFAWGTGSHGGHHAIHDTPMPTCCGLQTSLAGLANISCRGLRLADTIRTRRLTFAANRLRFIIMGSQTSGEGAPSVPMAVCHQYGRHTFYSTPHVVSWQIMASL